MHDTADLVAIDQLIRRYADISSRRAWDEFGEIILADAPLRFVRSTGDDLELTGPQGVAQLGQSAMADFEVYVYVPLNSVVDTIEGDRATGRAYSQEVATNTEGRWITFYGVYEDEYERRDGRWFIAARRYRTIGHRVEA